MIGFLGNKHMTKARLALLKIFEIMVESGLNVMIERRLQLSMKIIEQQHIIKRKIDLVHSIGGKISSLNIDFLRQLFYFVAYSHTILTVVLLLEVLFLYVTLFLK